MPKAKLTGSYSLIPLEPTLDSTNSSQSVAIYFYDKYLIRSA